MNNNIELKNFKKVSSNFIDWAKHHFFAVDISRVSEQYINNCFCEYCIMYSEMMHVSTQITSNMDTITYIGKQTKTFNNSNIYEKTFQYNNIPNFIFGTKEECLLFCEKNFTYYGFSDLNLQKFITILGIFDLKIDQKQEIKLEFKK